jgi:uncharacterized protein with HEPN domain
MPDSIFSGRLFLSEIKDILSLKGILDAAEKIVCFATPFSNPDDFFADRKSFDAVCMNFIVIGEMTDRISEDFKQKNSNIDWKNIKGLRNLIAHDYFGVDAEEIWGILQQHIPALIESIRKTGA